MKAVEVKVLLKTLPKPRMLEFPGVTDTRGSLYFVEARNHVPFDIARVYYINDVPNGESRGWHAHKTLQQALVVLSGSFEVELNDGEQSFKFQLMKANQGLYLPPGYWRGINNFASGSVLLALTSAYYDPDDYIRDYDEYLAWRRQGQIGTGSLHAD
ncbi:MAG: FdtA/QdtA family cupin domain-containing protein [Candidatus Obscuribacterales bacterium]|nr:FdtA/QdtA family cupin domain-containing protein [Candidatus Obscuribacterales bacterium]